MEAMGSSRWRDEWRPDAPLPNSTEVMDTSQHPPRREAVAVQRGNLSESQWDVSIVDPNVYLVDSVDGIMFIVIYDNC